MAKMNFISFYKTENGGQYEDFFRHSLKTIEAVKKREKKFIQRYYDNNLFKYLKIEGCVLEVWSTPDGFTSQELLFSEKVKNLID